MATQIMNNAALAPAALVPAALVPAALVPAALAIESLTLSRTEIITKLNLLYFQIDRLVELIRSNPEKLQKVAVFQSKVKELEAEKDGLNRELLENQIAQQDIEENEWANAVEANALNAQEVSEVLDGKTATNVFDAEMLDDFEDAVDTNAVDTVNAEVEDEDKLENCCLDCGYEWRDGFKEGWQKAMQYFEKNIKKTVEKTVAVPAKICSNCNADEELLKCNGTCNGAEYYCSETCQKVHWKAIHRFECAKL